MPINADRASILTCILTYWIGAHSVRAFIGESYVAGSYLSEEPSACWLYSGGRVKCFLDQSGSKMSSLIEFGRSYTPLNREVAVNK